VRELLSRGGHEVEDPTALGAGALLAASDWTADAVIAVLLRKRPPKQRLDAMLVEVGIALGRQLPVLLLADQQLALPPLVGVPRIDTTMAAAKADSSLLGTKINLFLRGVESRISRRPSQDISIGPGSTHPISSETVSGLTFQSQVGEVLRSTGVEVLRAGHLTPGSERADFAIYLPGVHPELGIVLVEAKQFSRGSTNKDNLNRAALQLSKQVLNAHASLGLLLYDGGELRLPATPLVVSMPLNELANRLADAPLDAVLRRARNEAIHAL